MGGQKRGEKESGSRERTSGGNVSGVRTAKSGFNCRNCSAVSSGIDWRPARRSRKRLQIARGELIGIDPQTSQGADVRERSGDVIDFLSGEIAQSSIREYGRESGQQVFARIQSA